MTTATLETPATLSDAEIYRDLHAQTHGDPAAHLRKLADWIEAHGLTPGELVASSVSQYDLQLHIEETAARRLFPGRKVTLDAGGNCYFREDGICFVFIADREIRPERLTL